MTRKIYDVRIYPGVDSGFDVILRLRGGIMKHGNFPSLEAALDAARAVEDKKAGQPVYVYDRSFPDLFAAAFVSSVERMAKKGGEA